MAIALFFNARFFVPTDFYLLVIFVTSIFSNSIVFFFYLFIILRLKFQSKMISVNINSIIASLSSRMIESLPLMGRATGPKRQQSRIMTSMDVCRKKRVVQLIAATINLLNVFIRRRSEEGLELLGQMPNIFSPFFSLSLSLFLSLCH